MLWSAGTVSPSVLTVRREEITVPDQSLDAQTSPSAATPSATPDDTSANHPEAAQQSSVEANAPQASQGQIQQADVTINQDPVISPADGNEDPGATGDNYDDEEAWPYRALQQEAKHRDLDASGKRDEIVARLREANAAGTTSSDSTTQDVPTSPVDPAVVENGGIQRTSVATEHASVLQGLSDQRRAQQLAAVRERSAQSEDASV